MLSFPGCFQILKFYGESTFVKISMLRSNLTGRRVCFFFIFMFFCIDPEVFATLCLPSAMFQGNAENELLHRIIIQNKTKRRRREIGHLHEFHHKYEVFALLTCGRELNVDKTTKPVREEK